MFQSDTQLSAQSQPSFSVSPQGPNPAKVLVIRQPYQTLHERGKWGRGSATLNGSLARKFTC